MTEPTSGRPDDLSFDKAIPAAAGTVVPAGSGASVVPGVTCANCGKPITDSYHTVNGLPICQNCRAVLETAARAVTDPKLIAKGVVFGIGAAIAGAFIYWAVIEFAQLEIGLVAILTGWMVGTAMRKGAENRGGLLLQIASAMLVYFSVAAAYMPFALAGSEGEVGVIGFVFLLVSLPLISVFASMPSGLISALIIGFGIRQAWRLTAAPPLVFQGPFRVGGAAAP